MMNVKLNIKVLRQMDNDMLRLVPVISQVKDDEQRVILLKEIEDKRKAIKSLFDHYSKVLAREQKGTGS